MTQQLASETGRPAPQRARRGTLHVFSDTDVRKLPPGMHSDGGGLIVHVEAGGTRTFRFRYTRDGHTHYVTLGRYPDRRLAEARSRAQECRNLLSDGKDPRAEFDRRAADAKAADQARREEAERAAVTLESFARKYHAEHKKDWTPQHGAQWLRSLELHVFPKIGTRSIAELRAADLLDLLKPLCQARPETGSRVRERLDAIFANAIVREVCQQNPAAAIRRELRSKGARVKKHHPSMDWRDIPAFIRTVRTSDRLGVASALGLEFLILTASRTSEVIKARFDEIDEAQRTWTCVEARMKTRQQHVVYLSDRAMEIVKEARKLGSDYLFPSPQRGTKPLSNNAFLSALKRLELRETEAGNVASGHGFRATFSTWANENDAARPDVIEAALAHTEGDKVRAAYNRAQYVEQRRKLAQAWADYCASAMPKTKTAKKRSAK